ncbi:hypothetical protein PSH01_06400 [Enterococcus faecalis]|uniref:ABC-three component system protein n=1 Tax=Enterococcus faecalis TaxID=1351 RepID=UPI0019285076|nr:ABC-three component system protein [Enterococcus faecalis]EGO2793372.1 hypothetical protein [Enterococcus faecalis]EGO8813882.1 hypothetical protein [Enterococcus faecalis]EHD7928446.1 hypothetical protein [Enterococcus faecalis]MCD5123035.1 hypothetical protein [Enterococcus faecalis]MDT2093940.1 hypothetical protein [Enterococcus faecalis]
MNNDASASWHGFEYQGKVTLYQVLKRTNVLLEEGKSEEISRYSFLVEGEEDFDIYEGDDLIELNQVKAQYTKKNISGYMEAILKLYARSSAKKNESVELNFHSVVEIADWDKKFESRYQKELQTMEKRYDENKLTDGEKDIYLYMKNISYDKVQQKICRKGYESGNKIIYYCPSDTIEELIEKEIKKNFELNHREEKVGDSEKYKIQLFFFMGDHIRLRASKNIQRKKISFQDIQECLNNDSVLIPDDKYYYGQIINRLCNDCLESYCNFKCELNEVCKGNTSCYLNQTLFTTLRNLGLEEAINVIIKMFPHIVIEDYNKDNYKIDKYGIDFIYKQFSKKYFYHLMKFNDNTKNYSMVSNDKIIYYPTGMVGDFEYLEEYKSDFNTNMASKLFPIDMIYEVNYLITKNLETGTKNIGDFYSDRLTTDEEFDILDENENNFSAKSKRNNYILNLKKIEDIRED